MRKLLKIFFPLVSVLLLLSGAFADDCPDLLTAAKLDDYDTVKELIEEGCDVNTKDNNGWTALLFASQKANIEIAALLIAKGADINIATPADGKTALMWAVGEGNLDTVTLLIKKGADINIKGKFDNTALRIAKKRKFDEIVQILTDAGAKE